MAMSPASVFAAGQTALITGGASGIGLAVALLCRSHGMKLALVDNNAELLAKAKQTIGSAETTETYELDVSQLTQWEELRGRVKSKFERVDFLMLNAGIGLKGGWGDAEYFRKVGWTLARSTEQGQCNNVEMLCS